MSETTEKEKKKENELSESQRKLFAEIEDARIEMIADKQNPKTFSIGYKGVSLETRILYFLTKWNLQREEILILEDKIFIKKSGWYRIAEKIITKTTISLEMCNIQMGVFCVKATVFVGEKSYEDFGFCSVPNEKKNTLAIALQTATSRAKLRAIQQAVPLPASSVEEMGDDADKIIQNTLSQVLNDAEIIKEKQEIKKALKKSVSKEDAIAKAKTLEQKALTQLDETFQEGEK
jgi:hypothetical protein